MGSAVRFDESFPRDLRAWVSERLAPLVEEGISVRVENPADSPELGWRVCLDTTRWATSFRVAKDATKDHWELLVQGFLRSRRFR